MSQGQLVPLVGPSARSHLSTQLVRKPVAPSWRACSASDSAALGRGTGGPRAERPGPELDGAQPAHLIKLAKERGASRDRVHTHPAGDGRDKKAAADGSEALATGQRRFRQPASYEILETLSGSSDWRRTESKGCCSRALVDAGEHACENTSTCAQVVGIGPAPARHVGCVSGIAWWLGCAGPLGTWSRSGQRRGE